VCPHLRAARFHAARDVHHERNADNKVAFSDWTTGEGMVGEAAMILRNTSIPAWEPDEMSVRSASRNEQFLLNVVKWLADIRSSCSCVQVIDFEFLLPARTGTSGGRIPSDLPARARGNQSA
jgi:hypothetical protein